MRHLGLLTLILILTLTRATHARAQDEDPACAALLDPNQLDRWQLDARQSAVLEREVGSLWDDDAALLEAVSEMLGRDAARVPQRAAELLRLRRLVDEMRAAHDGRAATAHALSGAALTPSVCGANPLAPARCSWTVLAGDVGMPAVLGAQCDDWKLVAGHVRMLASLLGALAAPHVEAATRSLEGYDRQWTQLATRGYSQYPWELWLNGLFQSAESWGPRRGQAVLAHAFAGFGVGNVGGLHREDAQAVAVLGVEALGYVRYLGDFRHHLGLGFAGISPNLSGARIAVGPVLHLSGVSLGYGYRVSGAAEHTLYLALDVTSGIDDGLIGRAAQRAFKSFVAR